MSSKFGIAAGVMLASGTANTILMKLICLQVVAPGPGMVPQSFNYPFFQTMLMMIGESMCLGAFFLTRGKERLSFPPSIMLIPTICNWTATTLVNAAYAIIPASSIQMCRGCIVVFTCLFSVVFLKRRQHAHHYLGVALAAAGITVVSLQAILYGTEQSTFAIHAWVGITLCIVAQLFQASMLVVEEKFLGSFHVPPLQMVGLEGLFGCCIGVVLLASLQSLDVERTSEAIYMMTHSNWLLIACVARVPGRALFNWSGVTVTQSASAVARSTIDMSRTTLVWFVELALYWNTFSYMQLCGFLILTLGTLIYTEIVTVPGFAPPVETLPLTAGKEETWLRGGEGGTKAQ